VSTPCRGLLTGLLMPIMAACGPAPDLGIRTVELDPPEDTVSAFEPFAVVDPDLPDRIIVGAQYGPGYNRGGLRMWSWSTDDGGRTWRAGRVIPKQFPPAGQALAADLTMAIGPDGTVYHLSLTSDSAPGGLMTAGAALAVSSDGGRSFSPRTFFGGVDQSSPGVMVFTDKSWMAVDRHEPSPYRGTIYLSWSRNRVSVGPSDTTVSTSPAFAWSSDGGRSISPPIALADSGFGTELAVTPDGVLHAVWTVHDRVILHRSSSDGGRSFGSPHLVAAVARTGAVVELPRLTAGPGGALLVCWTQGTGEGQETSAIWCATSRDGEDWSVAAAAPVAPAGVPVGYPAVAASSDAFWLLAYAADSSGLSVRLLRSSDGRSFTASRALASRPLPPQGLCTRPGLPCRRSGAGFFPGDYVTLAGSSGRLVAAYGLPRTTLPHATSIVVTVIDVP